MGVGYVTLPPVLCYVVHSNFQSHPPGLASFSFNEMTPLYVYLQNCFLSQQLRMITQPIIHLTWLCILTQSQTLPLPPPHLNPPQSVSISLQAKERQRSQRHQTDQRLLIDHMELGTHSKMSLPLPRLVKGGWIGTSACQLLPSAPSHLR